MASDVRPYKRLRTSEDEFVNYDVFISHRGPDTKTGIVGFLHERFKLAGLRAFLDCLSIDKGQDSWTCIEHAIKSSPLAVVIFSENYAQSEWCLKELHVLLENPGVKVVPLFYKVEPWEVRFPEKGRLADGFAKLKQRHSAPCIAGWREDLERASKLNGWKYIDGDERLERDVVNMIVGKMSEWANKALPLEVGEHVIGVDIVGKYIIGRLDQMKSVLMLGLWGMGGIGKSTLARELYNCLRTRFVASCFIEDVRDKVVQGGIAKVQSRMLKDLCYSECEGSEDKSRGKVVLEERLCAKKFLLVLDDVCGNDEMEFLISRKMLLSGSMCIVTSRNKRLFEKAISFDVGNEVYVHDVRGLGIEDSRRVFTSYAFGGDLKMREEFVALVSCIIKACGGVPLVLKVCGALLKGEDDMEIWTDVLKKLNCGAIMDEEKIFECLRMSYDSLQLQQQKMFLDIACALLGQCKDYAIEIWKRQGWYAALGVRSLVEKALVVVDKYGRFGMHDHLRDMGRAIVNMERGRDGVIRHLWDPESLKYMKDDVNLHKLLQTLVIFDYSQFRNGRTCVELDLSCLEDLRILRCSSNSVATLTIPKNLMWFSGRTRAWSFSIPQSSEVMILDFDSAELETLDESICNASKLEVMNLSCNESLCWLPNALGALGKLRILDLSDSGIEDLPKSFGSLSALESLNMSMCEKLWDLPDSFGDLGCLKTLNLSHSKIVGLPESFGSLSCLEDLNMSSCSKLEELPESFGGLGSLKFLDLSGCEIECFDEWIEDLGSNMKLTGLPNSIGGLGSLKTLSLFFTNIEGLPESFGSLSSLENLNMGMCKDFREIPDSFGALGALKTLDLEHTRIEHLPESFGSLSSLESLNMQRCEDLRKLPESFGGLGSLRTLELLGTEIEDFPESIGSLRSLESLSMWLDGDLRKLPDSFGGLRNLKSLRLAGSKIEGLPESFGSFKMLECLSMCSCDDLKKLPDSFGGLETLKTIDFFGSGIESLPESFGSLRLLESLDLSCCFKLRDLPDSFGGLQSLRSLRLSGSRFESLPKSFGNLSLLESLSIGDCDGLKKLPDSFGNLGALKTLEFSGSSFESFPETLGSLKSLENLDLSLRWNLRKLPESFGGLGTLKELKLVHSTIVGFPESFQSLSSLKSLDVSKCDHLKKLPDSFGSLVTLKTLKFSGCGLECLPESFGSLSLLESLDMSKCKALLKLPESFGGLGNLKSLQLNESGIGCLPDSFGSLHLLEFLTLRGCGALQKLPDSFGGLRSLKSLNLNESGIMGLPDSFGSLTLLKNLYMSQ